MIVKLLSIIKTLISEDDRLVKGSKKLVKTNYKGYNYVLEYGDHAFKRFDRYQNIEPMTKEEVSENRKSLYSFVAGSLHSPLERRSSESRIY